MPIETTTSLKTPNNAVRSRTTQKDDSETSTSTAEGSSQESIKTLLAKELEQVHVFSKTRNFIAHFLPQSKEKEIDYRVVIANLSPILNASIDKTTFNLQTLVPTWPPNSSDETMYYRPFAMLLTNIRDAVIPLARRDGLEMRKLEIFPYHRDMADQVYGPSFLRPDGLAAIQKKPAVHWVDVEFAFEVKDKSCNPFIQCASYAQAMFASRPGRRQAVIIHLDHKSTQVQVHAFNRSCVSSSLPLLLIHPSGIRNFIRIVTALFTTLEKGEDGSQDSDFILLPTCLIQIKSTLSQRFCVTGRSTHVVSGAVIAPRNQENDEGKGIILDTNKTSSVFQDRIDSAQRLLPKGSRAREGQRNAESSIPSQALNGLSLDTTPYSLERRHELTFDTSSALKPYVRKILTLSHLPRLEDPGAFLTGSPVVVKDSWPLAALETREMTILMENRGKWGIAELYTGYNVFDPKDNLIAVPRNAMKTEEVTDRVKREESSEEVEDFFRTEPLPMVRDSSSQTTITPHFAVSWPRTMTRLLFKSHGQPLTTVPDEHMLIRVIADAVIGHWSCFISGYLHGDISEGNLLWMPSAMKMELPAPFEKIPWDLCHGILVDFDLALAWEPNSTETTAQSGTLRYASIRLLQGWNAGTVCRRYPADDLESMAWTSLYTMLKRGEKEGFLSKIERNWLFALTNSPTVPDAYHAKAGILMDMEIFEQKPSKFEALSLCIRPLYSWIKACRKHAKLLDMEGDLCMENGETLSKDLVIQRELDCLYLKLIDEVVEFLEPVKQPTATAPLIK